MKFIFQSHYYTSQLEPISSDIINDIGKYNIHIEARTEDIFYNYFKKSRKTLPISFEWKCISMHIASGKSKSRIQSVLGKLVGDNNTFIRAFLSRFPIDSI